jgi:hypothetical protein
VDWRRMEISRAGLLALAGDFGIARGGREIRRRLTLLIGHPQSQWTDHPTQPFTPSFPSCRHNDGCSIRGPASGSWTAPS